MSRAEYDHHPLEWRTQTDAVLNQPAPVQNTWYNVLVAATYTFIDFIVFAVQTAGETIEIQVIVDDDTKNAAFPCGAGTNYTLVWTVAPVNVNIYDVAPGGPNVKHVYFVGHNVTVRIRKTTAVGAGNLQCLVKYRVSP